MIEQTIHGLTTGALAPDCEIMKGRRVTVTSGPTHQKMAADIWAVADLLRGDYKRHEYGQVILPFTVLRRLDAVMAPTREAVRARDAALNLQNKEKLLEKTAGLPFYNVSEAGLHDHRLRRGQRREEPARLRQRLLRERPRRSSTSSASTTRSPGWPRRSCSTRSSGVRRDAGPGQAVEPRDGLRLRGPDPEVRRGLQRDRR